MAPVVAEDAPAAAPSAGRGSGGGEGGGSGGPGSALGSKHPGPHSSTARSLEHLAAMDVQDKIERAGFPRTWSPFISLDDRPDAYEWFKIFVMAPVCLLRVLAVLAHLGVLWVCAHLKLLGMPDAVVR
jgi:hypothetical protein